jgi:hypothetical protein
MSLGDIEPKVWRDDCMGNVELVEILPRARFALLGVRGVRCPIADGEPIGCSM